MVTSTMVLKWVRIEAPRLCTQMNALWTAFSCFGFAASIWQIVRPTQALLLWHLQCFVDEACWDVRPTAFAWSTFWSSFAFHWLLSARASWPLDSRLWALMVLSERLQTTAIGEKQRLAGSRLQNGSWFCASLFKDVILSDKYMKAALSARKTCCTETAEYPEGRVCKWSSKSAW